MDNVKKIEGWKLSVLTTGVEHEGRLLIHDLSEVPYLLEFHGTLQVKVKGQLFSSIISKVDVSENLIFTHKHLLSKLQKPPLGYKSVLIQVSSDTGSNGEVTVLCKALTLREM